MLKHWSNHLTRDCIVVKVGNYIVYPIHRVGFTSLMYDADMTYTNTEISNLTHINVLIRDPESRFVSGVNEYCRQNNLDIHEVYEKIKEDKLVNSHFIPQYVWLLNLYRFYKGEVTIRPFTFIANITDVHKRKDESIIKVEPLKRFTEVDAEIIKNTTVQKRFLLKDIVKDYKHVLS